MTISYKQVKEYIEEAVVQLDLPLKVKGSLIKIPINEQGINLIKLANIKNLEGNQVDIDENRTISSVFLDLGPIDELDKKYNQYYNKEVCAELVLNNNRNEQYTALEKEEAERLFRVDVDSLDTIIRLEDFIVDTDENGYLVKESVYKKALEDLKEEYAIPNYVQTRDDLISELNKREFEINQMDQQKNILTKEITKKEENFEDLVSLISELNRDLELLKSETDKQEKRNFDELSSYQNQLNTLKSHGLVRSHLTEISTNQADIENLLSFTDFGSYSKLIDYIHGYILAKGIYYKRETILEFFALVRTHDFIILAGQSGVGKTSLVKEFANAVNAKYFIVPVKPNWMSKEDLLGYYNPIQKQYISTEFLDALIEARNNPDKPYFICLDEMNLARVEYYFADFMSKLEDRNNVVTIQLYSEDLLPNLNQLADILNDVTPESITTDNIIEYNDLIEYLNSLYNLNNPTSDDYYRVFHSLVPSVPPSITIGDNVHFFGTANIDETTHYFSSKILDRVHVLKFNNALETDTTELAKVLSRYKDRQDPFDEDLDKKVSLSIKELGERVGYPEISSNIQLKDDISTLYNQYLKYLNIHIGWRLIRQGILYDKQIHTITTNKDKPSLASIDGFIKHKILPRLVINNRNELEILNSLISYLSDLGIDGYDSYRTLVKMVQLLEQGNTTRLNYWDL